MSLVSPQLRRAIRHRLVRYRSSAKPLGISADAAFEVLLRQIYDSVRRVEYFFALRSRVPDPTRSDPTSKNFDPIRAAFHQLRANNMDEAAWLAFLSTHFGTNRRTGWRLVREVYGSLGAGPGWDWHHVRQGPMRFTRWLEANHELLKGGFGNHRKYMSLKPKSRAGTAQAIESYVKWVQGHSSHAQLLASFEQRVGNDRCNLFDAIYRDMRKNVRAFGRTGCFDFLCSLGKLGIFPIEPGSPYISGSTGPRAGAELLLMGHSGKTLRPIHLDRKIQPLGNELAGAGVKFAMQVVEDAICNWQKSPSQYERFSG
ncbi:hypothetical protein WMF27_27960 [Sorangium sp. So ce281]|uniref:alpha-glutamyl/putrescinyl thymine pyrophosphorylase clade 3 protein n=1 Tax=unclassified Sorangium TaxID=2621164 RepID=UPI003F6276D5